MIKRILVSQPTFLFLFMNNKTTFSVILIFRMASHPWYCLLSRTVPQRLVTDWSVQAVVYSAGWDDSCLRLETQFQTLLLSDSAQYGITIVVIFKLVILAFLIGTCWHAVGCYLHQIAFYQSFWTVADTGSGFFASPESTFNKFGLVYPLSLLVGIATIDCNGNVKYYVLADFTLVSVFDQATDVKMLLFHVIWFWWPVIRSVNNCVKISLFL